MSDAEVKPLVWEPHPVFGGDDLAVARVAEWGEQGHKYQVGRDADAPGYKAFLAPLYGSWFWTSDGHASLEDAKRAAQSDYEARIRSALVERKAEPVAWRYWDDENKTWMLADVCVPDGADIIEPLYSTPPAAPETEPVGYVGEASLALMRDRQSAAAVLNRDKAGKYAIPVYVHPHPSAEASPSPVDSRDGLIERLEAERAEQWRLRRDAEGSRDAARAAAHGLKNERDSLRSALSDILEGWDFWEVNPHDREPPRDAIRRARAALASGDRNG